ncbi:hypothetical protein BGX28_000299 [Mortierella sp. GBA30]|nr:hypothetical protein BGX28_000299 [Mortierella sp. GBA30]
MTTKHVHEMLTRKFAPMEGKFPKTASTATTASTALTTQITQTSRIRKVADKNYVGVQGREDKTVLMRVDWGTENPKNPGAVQGLHVNVCTGKDRTYAFHVRGSTKASTEDKKLYDEQLHKMRVMHDAGRIATHFADTGHAWTD